jgi:hypothetical protein
MSGVELWIRVGKPGSADLALLYVKVTEAMALREMAADSLESSVRHLSFGEDDV